MLQKQLSICLLLLVACDQQGPANQAVGIKTEALSKKTEIPRLDSKSFVILPFSEKLNFIFEGARPVSLSDVEIVEINSLLQKAIDEFNKLQEEEYQKMVKASPNASIHRENYFINLPNYRKQLIAVISTNGQKEVWVNCLCEAEVVSENDSVHAPLFGGKDYWRRKAVIVDDGGNCFFNIKINLTKHYSYDLMVNGLA